MEITEFAIRLGAAAASGILIGLERQLHHKAAGLKTNALVAIGSAIYVLLSMQLTATGSGDATRIIGQVVTGIGFLGAGVILHKGVSIQGLTTAATVWCSSAVGCLVASGYYWEGAISAGLIVVVNFLFRKLENNLSDKNESTK